MHTEVIRLAKGGDFGTICRDYLTPLSVALFTRPGVTCAAILAEQAAKSPVKATSISAVHIAGNEASYAQEGPEGHALYMGGRWRMALLSASERAAGQANVPADKAAKLKQEEARIRAKLRAIEGRHEAHPSAQSVLEAAQANSQLNRLEAQAAG
jgi:hypothetical protein